MTYSLPISRIAQCVRSLILSVLHASPPTLSPTLRLPPSLQHDQHLSPNSQVSCSRRTPSPVGEDMRIAQAWLADITSAHRLEKPVAPRSTHRTRPLLSRTSVWIISLLGKGCFVVYLFVPFSISFVIDLLLSIPIFPLLPPAPYYRMSRHLPQDPHPRRLRARFRAPRYDQVKFLRFGHHFLFASVATRVRRRQGCLHVRPFLFSSSQPTLCVDYVCLLFQTRIYKLSLALAKADTCGPLSPSSLIFACFHSPPTD